MAKDSKMASGGMPELAKTDIKFDMMGRFASMLFARELATYRG
jgi:hypothetical protein